MEKEKKLKELKIELAKSRANPSKKGQKIKEIKKIIFNFIWDGKPAKIKNISYYRRDKTRRTQDDRF